MRTVESLEGGQEHHDGVAGIVQLETRYRAPLHMNLVRFIGIVF